MARVQFGSGRARQFVGWPLAALLLFAACGRPTSTETGPALPGTAAPVQATDPLPSWNEGPARTALLDFVKAVTVEGGPDFVPVPQRIATFDNDGTLWSEQPVYFQILFVMDRVRAMAPDHPEWKTRPPFKAAIEAT